MIPGPARLDLLTRQFWRWRGRPVDLGGQHAWLAAPTSSGPRVGDQWIEAAAREWGGEALDRPHAGLVDDLARLDGSTFRASQVRPQIRDFYEHTADWRMEVWTQWNPLFRPGGEVVSRLFSRRVQQLALPTRAVEVAEGMSSRITVITDRDGIHRGTAWMRTLRATGDVVFSDCYGTRVLPGSSQPSVHVTFPLESGNVQVFLAPRVLPGGDLELSSPAGRFGQDGAYVVVQTEGSHAARVPLHEMFRVRLDDEGCCALITCSACGPRRWSDCTTRSPGRPEPAARS